ncbi:MAG TPA: hypothetical protein DCL43_00295, partial [Chitinophagaceae bacterium]|nr:hypothetical protein [Chitinophagaceae bacterium]
LLGSVGIALILLKPSIFTLVIGVGLASVGAFILFFLFKFLFNSHKVDNSNSIELKASDEPALFNFINSIADEVGTQKPKRIFLTSDVNAAVFYNSSFWSMFLPVRKNLRIGLGLMQGVTRQEFKGILAHEFGHFSQKSMKVGSYVYQVNRVIYNLLYENNGLGNAMEKWTAISSYFKFFVQIAVKIIQGIQFILGKMYAFVNLKYLALSREMEFHADEVAANVAGANNFSSGLLRLHLVEHAQQAVLNHYENLIEKCISTTNFFTKQHFVIEYLSRENGYNLLNGLPMLTLSDLGKYNRSKLNFDDQWASHPSTPDRIKAIENLNLSLLPDNDGVLAINLFKDPKQVQEMCTLKMLTAVTYVNEPEQETDAAFEEAYDQMMQQYIFSKKFNGYYDDHKIEIMDLTVAAKHDTELSVQDLFTPEMVELVYQKNGIEADINSLSDIVNHGYKVKSFDYDGTKYDIVSVTDLLLQLKAQFETHQTAIKKHDEAIYATLRKVAVKQHKELVYEEHYQLLFEAEKFYKSNLELFTGLQDAFAFLNDVTPNATIVANLEKAKPLEQSLKEAYQFLLQHRFLLQNIISSDLHKSIETYLNNELTYFDGEKYNEENLDHLIVCHRNIMYLTSQYYSKRRKQLLDFKASLLEA